MKVKKNLAVLYLAVPLLLFMTVPALATGGEVSQAIESTWQAAATQIKSVVNNVVFPAVTLILAVLFFVKLAMAYMDYKKHGSFEFAGPAILFGGLILALLAPTYLWTILGI
jgi:hypothetical protein